MKDSGNEVINHEGVVARNSGKSVIVSISAKTACSGCHAKGSCSLIGSEIKMIEVEGAWNVKPGDAVNVEMKQSMGFTALFYGYVLPFFSVVAVLVAMIASGMPELTAGLASLASLLPYYFILYLFRKRINGKFAFTLKV
jgi:sigma-E factor negative regulatory protein RseC